MLSEGKINYIDDNDGQQKPIGNRRGMKEVCTNFCRILREVFSIKGRETERLLCDLWCVCTVRRLLSCLSIWLRIYAMIFRWQKGRDVARAASRSSFSG